MANEKVKKTMYGYAINKALSYTEKDPAENIPKLMNLVDRMSPDYWFKGQRALFRKAINERNNWYQLILRAYQLDAGIRKTFFNNFIFNATLNGCHTQEYYSEKYNCNVPWAILMDPTSACNLKCKGCWAAEYGNSMNLDYKTLDSIVCQGKALGTHVYLYTGGEPLMRKKDIIRLCEAHPDCMFMAFTNGTLIDEELCSEMLRLKNFLVAVSLEGSEETNDARRGEGTYRAMTESMKLMKDHRIPFGVSTCYTSQNVDTISSEEYFDMMIESGAFFVWFFHYMPIGSSADTSLLPSPEQREKMYTSINRFRQTKPLFSIDFQNDGIHAGGCIAGGRRYLHINANGDIEPCAFIHYSDSNIHDTTLLEAYRRPLFMAYHDMQPFNENSFKPCPMLENPELIEKIISSLNAASTDIAAPESVEDLCRKTRPYAASWDPTAQRLWNELRTKKSI